MGNTLLALALLTLTVGCGLLKKKEPKEPILEPTSKELILSKRALYLDLASTQRDSKGWVDDTRCDGLLFNSLWILGGVDSNLELARLPNTGEWRRSAYLDCYASGQSRSACSRDGYMGLLHVALTQGRLDWVVDIISDGRTNRNSVGSWVMCEGDPGSTQIYLPEQETIYDIREALGGSANVGLPLQQVLECRKGFECHLLALYIHLRGRVHGGISAEELVKLRELKDSHPGNALYQALFSTYKDGDQAAASKILLDERLFPSDRLPTSTDRCEPYLWQRFQTVDSKPNPDWSPCPDEKNVHAGVDFLIVSAIVLGLFN